MTRTEEVEQAYKKAVELVNASCQQLPADSFNATSLIVALMDRMLERYPWNNMTAAGVESLTQ